GGHVVVHGTPQQIAKTKNSLTGQYLAGTRRIEVPERRRDPTGWLKLRGATEHNLKNVDVELPLGNLVAITGVSGAGKSSLINATLHPALQRQLGGESIRVGHYQSLEGL